MAASSKEESLASLFELQDKERLMDLSYISGGTSYKGRESIALLVLNKFRLEGEAGFCDVILEVEGRQLTTHRCILAANSQFFYTMFSSGMKESNQKLLSLQSVSFQSMSILLDYFYSREIVINDENVHELLNASSFLLVTPVKKACIEVLSRRLGSDNCFSIMQIAEQFGADELAKRAKDFIKLNFSIVVNNEEFVSISQEKLVHFISSDDIQVEKEEEVYQCVLKWVKHEASRVAVLPELLKHLRQGSLPKGFLESELTKEPQLVVADSRAVPPSKKVKKTKGTKRSKKSKSVQSAMEQQLRPSTEIHHVMIGIGTGDCCKAFCYDMSKKEILLLRDYSEWQIYDPQVAVVGRTVYLVGGQNYNYESVKRVNALCFDDAKKLKSSAGVKMGPEWKEKAPCGEARLKASLVALDGLLYYIGGWNSPSRCTNTVECYDPDMNEWYSCAGLNTSRCMSGCITTEKHIFIIGGGTTFRPQKASVLSSVEKYDPERNSWSYVSPLKEARSEPGCVYWTGKIYAIGGNIDYSGFQTSSCEVYSPNTDEWEAIARLPYSHCGFEKLNVNIIENQVHCVIVSLVNTTNYSCHTLRYCIRSKKWQKVRGLGPSDKMDSFSLSTLTLPTLILQRIPKGLCSEEFFEEWMTSLQEDAYSTESESESSSFMEWIESEDSDNYF